MPPAASQPVNLVVFGDLHVYRLWTWPWHLLSKRLLGQTNLWLNRRSKFDLDRLSPFVARATALEPTLVVHTGDLTTTALKTEFEYAAEELAPLLDRGEMYLVPGNHDRYTFTSSRDKRFEHYFGAHTPTQYPWHRKLNATTHLIGIDPTRPRMFNASGRLGGAQLERVRGMLAAIEAGEQLVLAGHYPLGVPEGLPPEPVGHAMNDAKQLIALLREAGHPTLYLHGHVHQPWCWRLTEAPNVVAINAGAPIMRDPLHPTGQGFWQCQQSAERPATWGLTRHVSRPDGSWAAQPVTWPRDPGERTEPAIEG